MSAVPLELRLPLPLLLTPWASPIRPRPQTLLLLSPNNFLTNIPLLEPDGCNWSIFSLMVPTRGRGARTPRLFQPRNGKRWSSETAPTLLRNTFFRSNPPISCGAISDRVLMGACPRRVHRREGPRVHFLRHEGGESSSPGHGKGKEWGEGRRLRERCRQMRRDETTTNGFCCESFGPDWNKGSRERKRGNNGVLSVHQQGCR